MLRIINQWPVPTQANPNPAECSDVLSHSGKLLNASITDITAAVQRTRDRSSMNLAAANREAHVLLMEMLISVMNIGESTLGYNLIRPVTGDHRVEEARRARPCGYDKLLYEHNGSALCGGESSSPTP